MVVLRSAARALEEGRWDSALTRALSHVWAKRAARGLVRPAHVPSNVAVVCVGGATIGGSGKTRVAIACARALHEMGVRAVLVGHAYRSRRAMPCVVRLGANGATPALLEDVGDEAIVCAQALEGTSVDVVVGPNRQAAIDHAMLLAPEALVLDGPLRITRPSNVLSLLAVDAARPWGSGQVLPAGDLRADRSTLIASADQVVPVDATPTSVRWHRRDRAPLDALKGSRVGLFTAIARPDRLLSALRSAGIEPESVVSVADHGPLTTRARRRLSSGSALDVWLATEKCALHLLGSRLWQDPDGGPELGIVESNVKLSDACTKAARSLVRRTRVVGTSH